MGLSLQLSIAPRQQLQRVVGGATEDPTIFPRTHKVLRRVSTQKVLLETYKMECEGYRSLMDALFSETFPQWKPLCFAFYQDRALPLRLILKPEHARSIDTLLLTYLQMAKGLGKEEVWDDGIPSWPTFIDTLLAQGR